MIDAAKIPYGRYMAQEAINNALIEHARQGKSVVRLKGGDPFVYGRGMEEIQALAEAGIPCTVVPGISSSISVPGAAGIPVTHRGVAHEFTVVSGHVAPDDERSLVDWPSLARLTGTLVVLMGVDKIGKIAETLIAHGVYRHSGRPGPGGHDGRPAPGGRDPGDGRRDRNHRGREAARGDRHRSGGHRRTEGTCVTPGNTTRSQPLAPHPGQGSITLWPISSPLRIPTTRACVITRA